MLWGCVSYHAYGPLESVDGHITSETYLRLLEIVVKPEMDALRQFNRVLVSQQDNAKALKTDAVMDYLETGGMR